MMLTSGLRVGIDIMRYFGAGREFINMVQAKEDQKNAFGCFSKSWRRFRVTRVMDIMLDREK